MIHKALLLVFLAVQDGTNLTMGARDLTAVGQEGNEVFPENSLSPESRNRRAIEDMQQLPQPPKMPDGMPNPMQGRKRRALESLAQQMPQQPQSPQFPNPQSSGQGQQSRNLVSGMAENKYAQVYRAKRSPQDAGAGSSPLDMFKDMAKNLPQKAKEAIGAFKEKAKAAIEKMKGMGSGGATGASPGGEAASGGEATGGEASSGLVGNNPTDY
ncbi:Hypothetical protein NTJ_07626 [Nesidiocoris tenuis]|uniref:Uncharacterized protein n=1 Tax=Nesidiocoris tenuis TaxID=355587 RepID=A0ABN7ATY8_9HEMI|nr:Hypothetical protein NTJ_07626 [Nesidiocoris tenuis]